MRATTSINQKSNLTKEQPYIKNVLNLCPDADSRFNFVTMVTKKTQNDQQNILHETDKHLYHENIQKMKIIS